MTLPAECLHTQSFRATLLTMPPLLWCCPPVFFTDQETQLAEDQHVMVDTSRRGLQSGTGMSETDQSREPCGEIQITIDRTTHTCGMRRQVHVISVDHHVRMHTHAT